MSAYQKSELFRCEVAEARSQRLEGEIILAKPMGAHLLTLLLAGIMAALAAWALLGTYTRSEIARGILVTAAPSAKVVAIRPGQVAALHVADGEIVRAGQKLATITVEQANEAGGSATAEGLAALAAQQVLAGEQILLSRRRAAADRARLSATRDGLARQRATLSDQIALQEQMVASAKETFERIGQVVERGFVSRVEFERRRQAMLAARQQLAQLRQQEAALSAEGLRANAEIGRVGADAGSEIVAARASAEGFAQQRAQLTAARAYILTAARYGRVTALQTSSGRTVDGSAPLMTIVPDGAALRAEIYAPTRAVGFVKRGQEVRLLYDAFPYQRFGSFKGRVTRVSRTILDPREINSPLKIEEPVYRIEVALDRQEVEAFGERLALQPGMTLSANLILDRRSFLDWLLQPLNAVLRRNN